MTKHFIYNNFDYTKQMSIVQNITASKSNIKGKENRKTIMRASIRYKLYYSGLSSKL